jgi:prepilin-type N-terminal cleavage/methylation domain-containing protein
MKTQRQSGFTLIELTLVMGISVMVAGALIGMFQAHIQMLTQAAKYNFLAQDAPFIGLLLTRTIGNAEDYRIYSTGAVARSSNGVPVLNGLAVKLWMRQPNSTFRQAVVSFETPANGHQGIYFYVTDSTTGTFPTTPNWELAGAQAAGQITAVTFAANTGVLLATLTGSYFDQYIFSAEKK